jgi:hypothetical protein
VIDTPHDRSPHSVHVVSEKSKVSQVGRECKRREAEHAWRAVSYAGACMGRCARGVVHSVGYAGSYECGVERRRYSLERLHSSSSASASPLEYIDHSARYAVHLVPDRLRMRMTVALSCMCIPLINSIYTHVCEHACTRTHAFSTSLRPPHTTPESNARSMFITVIPQAHVGSAVWNRIGSNATTRAETSTSSVCQ